MLVLTPAITRTRRGRPAPSPHDIPGLRTKAKDSNELGSRDAVKVAAWLVTHALVSRSAAATDPATSVVRHRGAGCFLIARSARVSTRPTIPASLQLPRPR